MIHRKTGDKRIKENCPFCGCEKEKLQIIIINKQTNQSKNYVTIKCPNCNCSLSNFGLVETIAFWNRRVN